MILVTLQQNCTMFHACGYAASDRYDSRGVDSDTLTHLVRKLKYPPEDILRAIQEVGADPEEIKEYIRDRYERG